MPDFRRNNRPNNNRFHTNRNNDRRENSKAECYTLRIEKMVQGGEGMARLEDGRVCFVAGALPGELCKVRLTFQKKDFTKGRVVEVIEASPDRVKPHCPLYGKCGGCSLQHLASEKQAEYLEKVERENFKRLAHAELPADFVIHTGSAWGYRNRARVVFRKAPEGRATFGFRGEESNNVIPFENCPVLTDALNAFLRGPAATLLSGVSNSGSNGHRDFQRSRDIDVNVFDNGKGEVSFYYPGMHKSEFDAHAVSVVEIAGRKIEADASVFFQSNLGLLPELAKLNGIEFDKFATGHYARVEKDENGRFILKRGIVPKKDQSYFLYRLPKERLEHILLPLGGYTKDEIRKISYKKHLTFPFLVLLLYQCDSDTITLNKQFPSKRWEDENLYCPCRLFCK